MRVLSVGLGTSNTVAVLSAHGRHRVLVFTVRDRPLVGRLTRSEARDLTPDALADYFASRVQPGT